MAEDAALWPDEFHAAAANGHQVIGIGPDGKAIPTNSFRDDARRVADE